MPLPDHLANYGHSGVDFPPPDAPLYNFGTDAPLISLKGRRFYSILLIGALFMMTLALTDHLANFGDNRMDFPVPDALVDNFGADAPVISLRGRRFYSICLQYLANRGSLYDVPCLYRTTSQISAIMVWNFHLLTRRWSTLALLRP